MIRSRMNMNVRPTVAVARPAPRMAVRSSAQRQQQPIAPAIAAGLAAVVLVSVVL